MVDPEHVIIMTTEGCVMWIFIMDELFRGQATFYLRLKVS